MRFAKQMAFYSAYHQEKRNILIHVVGVPTITFSVLLVLSWIKLFSFQGMPVTVAMVFTAAVLLYYFTLDFVFALTSTILFGSLLAAAHYLSLHVDPTTGWIIFGTAQVLGWGTQFYGHFVFEKDRPALFDNLFQALISAPIFVVADVFFELGLRTHLEEQVKEILAEQGKLKTFEAVAS
ncbi:MAG: hypothetical protein CMN76_10630 [Spirochaetaceae bacterium]|nr:hypothetical protein [Spirochaetaceae bacterium]|tara:strand:+ start:4203 stop:4742 length:540 start_codon:yes stop_codon:yes gene_type:complete